MSKTLKPETESPNIYDSLADGLEVSEDALRFQQDPFALVESGKLMIKTKAGELIPFVLNPAQRKILKVIKQLYYASKPIRMWILKARQEGVSTLIEAIIYAFTSQRENINSLILADDVEGANYLFGMSKIYHDQLDESLRFELVHSNQKKLEFADRYSGIRIDTAEHLEAGRKYTFQLVHLSEVAYFRNGRTLMTGLNQAVPDLPFTMIIGETTANGVGGYFYAQWKKAEKGETDWYPLFIPWFENDEYAVSVPDGFQPTDEEFLLQQKYPQITNGKLAWRRNAIKNKCDGSVDIFQQEYPSNSREAFLVSGNCRFNVSCLKKMEDISINEGTPGRLVDVHKNIVFESDVKGKLRIWHKPERGEIFVLGSDVAEGIEVKTEGEKERDYSTAEVLNLRTLEQVAELRCRLEPDVFAVELARLGKYYHTGLVGVERNNHGIAVLQALKGIYSNLYYMEIFAEETQTRTKKLGWLTSLKTKPLMIAELDKVIREAISLVHSPELLSELMTYIRFPDGSTGAQGECFDDLVIAYAIALQMRKYAPAEEETGKTSSSTKASRQVEQEAETVRGY